MLTCFSRHFSTKFDNFVEREILREILREALDYCIVSDDLQLKSSEKPPNGYIPSWAGFFESGSDEVEPAIEPETVVDVRAESSVEILGERWQIFGIFVHWLYMQSLPASPSPYFSLESATSLSKLYALAERLDVPISRKGGPT